MIQIAGEVNWTELEDQIRHVPLLQPRDGQIIYPYLHAVISLKGVQYDEVCPTSLYALTSHLAFQMELSKQLAPNHDPLALRGGLQLMSDNGAEVGLIPPIVEETETHGQYILDGLHRTLVGMRAGRTAFTAIHIQGFRDDCPAAALPNEWSDVIEYDMTPTDPAQKRRYRPSHMSYRRDFSALNGSRPRS